jgi:hypothetical protein
MLRLSIVIDFLTLGTLKTLAFFLTLRTLKTLVIRPSPLVLHY